MAAQLGALVITLVLLAVALDAAVRHAVWAQHDRGLAGRARALALLVEHDDEDGFETELDQGSLPGAYVEVWRPDGSVLVRSAALGARDLPAVGPGSLAAPRLVNLTLPDGRPGRLALLRAPPRTDDDESGAAGEQPGDVTIALAEDTAGTRATVAAARRWIWGLGLGALAVAALASAWLIGRGLAPLARLGAAIAAIDDRTLSARLPVAGQPRELVAPVARLNELLVRLEASFARERRFTADVSHELRTPLAGLRALLEVTACRERSGEAYRAALAEARAMVVQLGALVDSLLTLARVDAGQLDVAREEVVLHALVEAAWAPHAATAAARGLTFENLIDAAASVRTDPALLGVVVGNLLANAAAYTAAGGWIEVRPGDADAGVLLDVVDSGPPIPEAHLERLFERFWRADAARTNAGAHFGIGLSLVRALCASLGVEVAAANLPGGAVRFRLSGVVAP
jgi:signal transduction histidine kinase